MTNSNRSIKLGQNNTMIMAGIYLPVKGMKQVIWHMATELYKNKIRVGCRQPSNMSNASLILRILDLISVARLAGCEQ